MTTRDPSQSDEAEPSPSNRAKDPEASKRIDELQKLTGRGVPADQHRTDEPAKDQPRTNKRGS